MAELKCLCGTVMYKVSRNEYMCPKCKKRVKQVVFDLNMNKYKPDKKKDLSVNFVKII